MRGPKPTVIELTDTERDSLTRLTRQHKTPQQIVLRARIILACAEGLNNAQVARQLDISVDTARHWRRRWLGLQAVALDELSVVERLEDAPRPGKPPRITAEQVCQLVALACERPQDAARPSSQWTGRELADELMNRGIIETISSRHVSRLLKRGRSSRTASATG
ncbi:MAG TPA: helix-turn-helix domain-containing protein [Nitrospira sp.]|nr:helix-turn-helix domain-containing protein [Nitrospira sp.]HNM20687.1 helix-turn-helix domain-containing protein [Nitrospira sp.]